MKQKANRGRLVAESRCGYELVSDFFAPLLSFTADHYNFGEMLHKSCYAAPGPTRSKQFTRGLAQCLRFVQQLLVLLALSKDSCPVKLLPALFESFRPPIYSPRPAPLSLDDIRLKVEHSTNYLSHEQITLWPTI
jgi:hypothetical protein